MKIKNSKRSLINKINNFPLIYRKFGTETLTATRLTY